MNLKEHKTANEFATAIIEMSLKAMGKDCYRWTKPHDESSPDGKAVGSSSLSDEWTRWCRGLDGSEELPPKEVIIIGLGNYGYCECQREGGGKWFAHLVATDNEDVENFPLPVTAKMRCRLNKISKMLSTDAGIATQQQDKGEKKMKKAESNKTVKQSKTTKTTKTNEWYKKYSDTAHNESEVLTDRQFFFVDWCVCEVEKRIARELAASGKYDDLDVEELTDAVDEVFKCEDFIFAGNYEKWYDKDEETVIDNILDAVSGIWSDYDDIVEETVQEWRKAWEKEEQEEKELNGK